MRESTGSLQEVVAGENRAGRWIRQVARIEVVDPLAGKAAASEAAKQ